jgi:hypothetical protein
VFPFVKPLEHVTPFGHRRGEHERCQRHARVERLQQDHLVEQGCVVEDTVVVGGGQDDDAGCDEPGRSRSHLLKPPGDPADERQHDEEEAVFGARSVDRGDRQRGEEGDSFRDVRPVSAHASEPGERPQEGGHDQHAHGVARPPHPPRVDDARRRTRELDAYRAD